MTAYRGRSACNRNAGFREDVCCQLNQTMRNSLTFIHSLVSIVTASLSLRYRHNNDSRCYRNIERRASNDIGVDFTRLDSQNSDVTIAMVTLVGATNAGGPTAELYGR